MTTTNEKLRSIFLAALMVFSVFGGTIALSGSAAATANSSITASPDTAGNTATHTVTATVESNDDSGSLSDLEVDYSVGSNPADVSNVQQGDVTVSGPNGPNPTGVSTSNNGETLLINFDGSTTLSQGDQYTVTIENVVNPSQEGDTDVDVTINTQSTDNPTTSTLSVGGADVDLAADAPGLAEAGSSVTVTGTVTNNAGSEITQDVRYTGAGTTSDSPQTVTLGSGESTTVEFDVDLGGTAGDTVTHTLETGSGSNVVTATAETELTDADNSAFITGDLRDQNGNRIANASDVELIIEAETSPGSGTYVEIQNSPVTVSGANDEYTQEVPVQASGTSYRVSIDTAQVEDATGTSFESFARTGEVAPDSTERFDVRLKRIVNPAEIDVETVRGEATANGQDQVQYIVTVTGDDGQPFEGADVVVTPDPDNDLTFETDSTQQTDENGEVRFNISSNTVQDVEFTFTEPTEDLETTADGTFVPESGEGNLYGSVVGQDTTEGIEGGSVWIVRSSDYEDNQVENTIDLADIDSDDPGQNGDTDDNTVFIRLVDAETGSIISPDDYDIRAQESVGGDGVDPEGTGVTLVDQLNKTDAAVGGGYALIDTDASDESPDEEIVFSHARVEAEDYYAQVSYDAANASDFDGDINDTLQTDENNEAFVNVTSTSSGTTGTISADDIGTGDAAVFEPSANLTLERAVEDSESSGANLADTEGFTNSFGVDTGGTNADGDYVLSEIPTNYQAGIQYVAIADAPSYSTDFADVFLQEDGQLTFDETQGSNNFYLEPVPVQPDAVNITQVGTKENFDADTVEFDNKTDAFYQEVPRDGETIDVFNVETAAEGEPVNATVTVTFDATVVEGEFVNIAGGEFVSVDDENNTATLYTGSDGQAQVWYQADQGSETIDTQKRAVLDSDTAVEDTSNVTFVGVKNLGSASISGIVTDSNDRPLPQSAVWAKQFTVGDSDAVNNPDRIVIEPNTTAQPNTPAYGDAVDEDTDPFDVLLQEYNTSSGEYETVNKDTTTAGNLQSYEFSAFPSINAATEYKLYQRADENDQGEEASYTFEPVPALEGTLDETDYRIGAARTDAPFKGADSNDALPSVLPNTTATANVVIPITVSDANIQVSGVDDQTITEGENTTVTATVENVGGNVGSTQTIALTVDGTVVASQERTLSANDTASITLEGDTSDLSAGEYDLTVASEDDSGSATLTVEGDTGGSSLVDQYDENDDGDISAGELGEAGQAFTDGELTAGQLGQLGEAFTDN